MIKSLLSSQAERDNLGLPESLGDKPDLRLDPKGQPIKKEEVKADPEPVRDTLALMAANRQRLSGWDDLDLS